MALTCVAGHFESHLLHQEENPVAANVDAVLYFMQLQRSEVLPTQPVR